MSGWGRRAAVRTASDLAFVVLAGMNRTHSLGSWYLDDELCAVNRCVAGLSATALKAAEWPPRPSRERQGGQPATNFTLFPLLAYKYWREMGVSPANPSARQTRYLSTFAVEASRSNPRLLRCNGRFLRHRFPGPRAHYHRGYGPRPRGLRPRQRECERELRRRLTLRSE